MLLNKIPGLEELESDELYKQFLAEDFDVKSVASSAVQCGAVAEQLARLSGGVMMLDKALHRQVGGHYEDLLSQATEIETFEGVLTVVHQQIDTLLAAADKLKVRVVEPYETIATLTRKLQRLHAVCDLLRKVIRVVRLSKRLKGHLARDELTKAASCISELDDFEGLSGLTVVEAELNYIHQAKAMLENKN